VSKRVPAFAGGQVTAGTGFHTQCLLTDGPCQILEGLLAPQGFSRNCGPSEAPVVQGEAPWRRLLGTQTPRLLGECFICSAEPFSLVAPHLWPPYGLPGTDTGQSLALLGLAALPPSLGLSLSLT
jgi:hypothetical protein